MASHLHLVTPQATLSATQVPSQAKSAEVLYLQSATYTQLKVAPVAISPTSTRPHYWTYACVVIAHVGILMWMMDVSTIETPAVNLPAPMMVSLVENPTPEPEVAIVEPTPPVPVQPKVVQPKKPVIKQVETPQPVVQESTPVESTPVVSEAPPTALSPVVKVAEATAPVVVEAPPVVEPPRFGAAYLNNPAPTYPALSRRLGEEGRALLRVLVAENGSAKTVDLETSSGSTRLDQAAIAAVKNWEFIPAKRDRQNISAYVLVPIKFSLN